MNVHRIGRIGLALTAASWSWGAGVSPQPEQVKIGGYLGARLDACIAKSVKATDAMALTDLFKSKAETHTWQTEFWGKWMHAAVPLARYANDPALKAAIDASVKNLLATQRPDGYIGNYTDAAQTTGPWDIWGRKYTMLGLLHQYDATGDKTLLDAACRVADHLMTQVGPGKKDLYKIGAYHGMASCSVLEPILWLHRRTRQQKYLDFATYIVSQMEDPADSAKLVTKALQKVDVGSRFPHPSQWWVWENGMKAYEMMSCYQGLLEYYWTTGDKKYLDAVIATAENIAKTEINLAGSGAAFECWYHGQVRQTAPAYHMMETCVTTTWLRLCESLLRETGDPKYADWLEKTLYNAYLAALSFEADTFSKYCPLEGMRGRGEDQCRTHTNCCIANGPRGFVALLESLAMTDGENVNVNLYLPSTVTLTVKGQPVRIEQATAYPKTETVTLTLSPAAPAAFTLKLRIPAWSDQTAAAVNGEAVADIRPGSYLAINRTWKPGDTVTLTLDLHGRATLLNNHLAFERGPITLARDARFNDGNIHEVCGAVNAGKPVPMTLVSDPTPGRWICVTTPLQIGMNLETPEGRTPRPVHFCDFASAGNTWKEDSLYRVWQRIPLNVTQQPYKSYNAE